jgi:diacylglycerol O-acyltransferase 1
VTSTSLPNVCTSVWHAGKPVTGFVVFFVSAVLHELALSAPLQVTRSWALLGMMAQVPLVLLTLALPRALRRGGASEEAVFLAGNAALWISFCFVGQPLCVVLYATAYDHKHAGR